jgi:hypothetical protein
VVEQGLLQPGALAGIAAELLQRIGQRCQRVTRSMGRITTSRSPRPSERTSDSISCSRPTRWERRISHSDSSSAAKSSAATARKPAMPRSAARRDAPVACSIERPPAPSSRVPRSPSRCASVAPSARSAASRWPSASAPWRTANRPEGARLCSRKSSTVLRCASSSPARWNIVGVMSCHWFFEKSPGPRGTWHSVQRS